MTSVKLCLEVMQTNATLPTFCLRLRPGTATTRQARELAGERSTACETGPDTLSSQNARMVPRAWPSHRRSPQLLSQPPASPMGLC